MSFTRSQTRAIWALVIIWAVAIAYHYFHYYWQVRPFSREDEFLKKFQEKRTEILGTGQFPAADSEKIPQPSVGEVVYQSVEFPLDLNRASALDLEQLPRIGPKMAERIVEYRKTHGPFRKKEDLMKVKGIGKKTFQKIQPLITIKSN